jgi:hypothetical protein
VLQCEGVNADEMILCVLLVCMQTQSTLLRTSLTNRIPCLYDTAPWALLTAGLRRMDHTAGGDGHATQPAACSWALGRRHHKQLRWPVRGLTPTAADAAQT